VLAALFERERSGLGRAPTARRAPALTQAISAGETDMTEDDVLAALVGAWELVRWSTVDADGVETLPFGADATGLIVYTEDGHMSCHLSAADRPHFGAPTSHGVSDEDLGRAMRTYSGYFGTFSIDVDAGVVTHHVRGAWYPDFALVDQPRRYSFDADRLVLEAESVNGRVQVVWQRRRVRAG